jgi:erythromycin esterase-like protein
MISPADRRTACLAIALLLTCLAAAWAQAPGPVPQSDAARRPKPVGDPIQPGLWRLHGTDPNLPQADLEPLRKILRGAQFVGLGESIHTSGGFYELKDRVFRFLVEKMGFRVFGMETPWIRAEQVAQFVQTCDGSARDAIRGIFGVWQSSEVEAMVQWMCEWNLAHPKDRVHFYGFDIQNQAPQHVAALTEFLHRLGIGDDDPRLAGLRVCPGVGNDSRPAECRDALTEIAAWFDREEKPIVQQTSKQDLAWARVHLVGQQAWLGQISNIGTARSGRERDKGMAYVAQAIHALRFPRARTVLWAHNGHLAKNVDVTDFVAVEMGTLLAQALKKKYAVIGLVARETSIDWPSIGCGRTNLWSGIGSIEQELHGLDAGAGVLADLTARSSLPEPGASYSVGSVNMVPVEQFNALLYLEVSPKMHPLAWPSCQ